jgi:hypothetical protein
LDLAFLLPLGKLAKQGLEATGAIAIHAGDKLSGNHKEVPRHKIRQAPPAA